MESKQLNIITKEQIISQIQQWYRQKAMEKVNAKRFDLEEGVDMYKYDVLSSLERILQSDLCCDLQLSDEFIEKAKLYANGL